MNDEDNQLVELVYGDTDSLYMSYEGLLNTIEGVEKMSIQEKTELIVKINTEFLNQHNKEFMDAYFAERHCRDMVHEFELETVAKAGVWLNVKKRYAQILAWKDGKYFDEDDMPTKVKGLEVVKSSYPSLARKMLKDLIRTLIDIDDKDIIHSLNIKMQQCKQQWLQADIESICPTISVNNYYKYVITDDNPLGPEVEKGCPFAVRGLATYNCIRQTHKLPGDPLYGGKMRYYVIKTPTKSKNSPEQFFCFQGSNYPDWAPQYAPVDRNAMFKRCVLDPFNRILSSIGEKELSIDGYIQISLFDL